MKVSRAIVFVSSAIVFVSANAQVSLNSSSATYSQNFDSLTNATTANQAWSNNNTLAGWSLFTAGGADITTYTGSSGTGTAGSFYSFGNSADRALGGLTSGGAYFGTPASGAVAGYTALALSNNSGGALDSLTLSYAGEQWRNGGNTSVPSQSLVLQYGFGSSYAAVSTWNTPGGSFDFVSPVTTGTAASVDGNAAGHVNGLGGTLSDLNWSSGDTLWIRWQYTNNVGNDHGLAIDDLSVSVAAATPVPEPSQYALLIAGLGAVGLVVRRRGRQNGV